MHSARLGRAPQELRPAARACAAASLAVAMLALGAGCARAEPSGRLRLEVEDGWGKPVPVHVYAPRGIGSSAPILFVLHGMRGNAEEYLEAWIPEADRHGVLLVAPQFSAERYRPSRVYQAGNVLDGHGRVEERRRWVFAEIERIFDRVREATGNRSSRYLLYGHSAGAQFVHRMVLLQPDARFAKAVAANAGSYTMADFDVRYPYGLRGVPVGPKGLRAAFGRPLIVLLGERDADPKDPSLPDTAGARRQGDHRLARGRAFFERAERLSRELDAELEWRIETVPDVGHDHRKMVRAAAGVLFGDGRP